jgi:hypothetical protein
MTDAIRFEYRYTRDVRVPLVDGDDDFDAGWQCIPVRPTDDGGWWVFDSSKDTKTGWMRCLSTRKQPARLNCATLATRLLLVDPVGFTSPLRHRGAVGAAFGAGLAIDGICLSRS